MAVVRPEEIADLIRRTSELQHELRVLQLRLAEAPGPMATVAAAAMEAVEREFDGAAEALRDAAGVVTLVSSD